MNVPTQLFEDLTKSKLVGPALWGKFRNSAGKLTTKAFAADEPPIKLDTAIIFALAGELVPKTLKAMAKGGTVVGGIHMSPIPSFDYSRAFRKAQTLLSTR